jgi:hypothetical protein
MKTTAALCPSEQKTDHVCQVWHGNAQYALIIYKTLAWKTIQKNNSGNEPI